MSDIGRCIVPDCEGVPAHSIVGTRDDGDTWYQLTRPSGEWVRSCTEHLPEVLHRMTTFEGSPPRVAQRSFYDSTHGDSPARPDPNRADRRRGLFGGPDRGPIRSHRRRRRAR